MNVFFIVFFLFNYSIKSTYISDSDESDVETDYDVDNLPTIEVPPTEHKLQYCYNLWFSKKGAHRSTVTQIKATEEYSKSLHCIGRFASVEQFWGLYSHLVKPTGLKPYRELHLFKVCL